VKGFLILFALFLAIGLLAQITSLINACAAKRLSDDQRPVFTPNRSQRVLYLMGSAALGLSFFAALWVAALIAPIRVWWATTMLITAVLLILFGAIPAIVAVARGRFELFRSSVEQQARWPFRWLVVLWIVVIATTLLDSLYRFYRP
jgi:hypothetical protein